MTIQGAIAELQNLLDADDVPFYYKGGIEKVIETIQMELADHKTEPSIDIIRCKDCDNYAGEGMYCAWNVLTGDMGYCHHARPKGSTDITAEQTEPTISKMEQVDKDINVRSKIEPQTIIMVKDHGRKQALEMIDLYHELKDEPQTERRERWQK